MAKKITFKNGLRLLLVPQPSSLASTILILVEAGSEYEAKNTSGLSHFLEHMTFKGTVNRPKPGMIAQELDSLGAQSNAFTSQEYTGYWAKAQNKKLERVLEIVSDLYLNPLFNEEEINKERGVVIEEINLYEDTPMRRVQELFTSLLYGDQPAGWDIAGRKEVIRKMTRNDFLAYRDTHYVAPKTVVVVSGDVGGTRIKNRVKELFGHLPRARRVKKPSTVIPHQRKPALLIKHKESDQSHLVLGVHAFTIFDRRRYPLMVLADILGGSMSSRLFRRVREELGAAYYIRAGTDLLIDHGHFEISSGVDHAKIEVVIKAVLEELRRIKEERLGAEELQKSRDHLTGNLLLSLESSDELASFYGDQEILTRTLIDPPKLIEKIQKVSADEIRAVARAIFKNSSLSLAVIGPYKKRDVFRKILFL